MNARKFLSVGLLTAAVAVATSTTPAQAGLSIAVLTEDPAQTPVDTTTNGYVYKIQITRSGNDLTAASASLLGGVGEIFSSNQGSPNSLGASGDKYFFSTGENTGGTNNQTIFRSMTNSGQLITSTSPLLVIANVPGGISGADAMGDTYYYYRDGNGTQASGLGTVTGITGNSPQDQGMKSITGPPDVGLGDLAIDRTTGQGYLAYSVGSANFIAKINIGTGQVSAIESTSILYNGLAFDEQGNLYGTSRAGGGTLYALDKTGVDGTNGGVQLDSITISGLNGTGITDASMAAVPEPVSILAGLIGLPCVGGVVGFARRKLTKVQA